jgi:hypothetical protein
MSEARFRSSAISQVGFSKSEISLKWRDLEDSFRSYRFESPSVPKYDEGSAGWANAFLFFPGYAPLMQCCTSAYELKNLDAFLSSNWQASDSPRICMRGTDLYIYVELSSYRVIEVEEHRSLRKRLFNIGNRIP